MRDETPAYLRARHYFYEILESQAQTSRMGVIVNRFIVFFIVLSVGITVMESVPAMREDYGRLFQALELLCLVMFSIEYYIRIWIAPEHLPYHHMSPLRAAWAYMISPRASSIASR